MAMTPPFRSDRHLASDDDAGNNRQFLRRWWQNLSIRSKTTALAIALGSAPVLLVGASSYVLSNRAIIREIATIERTRAVESQHLINVFMRDRLIDIKTLAELDIFTDTESLEDPDQVEQRTEIIERFKDQAGDIYNSIGVFDVNGDVLAETSGAKPLGNHLKRTYITAAREENGAVLSNPAISSSSGIFSVYAASVIKDRETGELIGYVRARIPVAVLQSLLEREAGKDIRSLYLVDSDGQIFLGPEGAYLKRVGSDGDPLDLTSEEGTLTSLTVNEIFGNLNLDQAADSQGSPIHRNEQLPQRPKQLVAYSGTPSLNGLPDLGWGTLLATDISSALAPQKKLLFTLVLGSIVAALGSAILAIIFARRATQSILAANRAVRDIGAGNLTTRLAVQGTDEIGQLSQNINRMASQLDESERGQMLQASQSNLLASITSISPELPFEERVESLNTVLDKARRLINVDRCLLVNVQANGTQTILAESVDARYPQVLEQNSTDGLLTFEDVAHLRDEQLISHTDVAQTVEVPEQVGYLAHLQVKSALMVPIIGQNQFFGTLIAHHCKSEHSWTEREIDLTQQITRQLGILFVVEEFSKLAEEQRELKEGLQQRALDLMIQVDPVSQGDLTVRARVTEDEIGTLADSYNATIESLQKLVTQVQSVANQVITTANGNDTAVQTLSAGAIAQTEKISAALERIQSMAESTQAVSFNAEQAAQVAQQTALIVESGDQAMNRTVDGITSIRETVAETAKKVKNLGESSQKISKVVNLIETFAAQTNLLALNASIEAARAGEEGRGFAVVADEVRSLAYQSGEAASEIEKLVNDIQTETNEVVVAMETGTEQVVTGTKLVQETKQSLTEITTASAQIRDLVTGIVDATSIQNNNADAVTQTIESVATISDKTTQEISQVSQSFNELLDVAQSLKQSLDQFKVN